MRTPESLMRAIPGRPSVCSRTLSTPATAVRACVAIRCASRTIVMTIAAATRMTTIPRISPTVQPVVAAIGACISHLLRSSARTPERPLREHADDMAFVFLGPALVADRRAGFGGFCGRLGEPLVRGRLADERALRGAAGHAAVDRGECDARPNDPA